jgi:anthranilate synthase component I
VKLEALEPSFAAFEAAYNADKPQLIWTRLPADLETPVSAYLKVAMGRPYAFLLESVEGGATRGRYSMIGLDPDVIWRCEGQKAYLNMNAEVDPDSFTPESKAPLDSFRKLLAASTCDVPKGHPPMSAGIFGYMGYDMVRLMERLPQAKPDPVDVPDAIMVRPTVMIVFDSVRDEMWLVSPVRPEKNVSPSEARRKAEARLMRIMEQLEEPTPRTPYSRSGEDETQSALNLLTSNTPTPDYLGMVEKAKEYIRAGDIFQVVLSQRFEAPFSLPPFVLYRALRRVNPAPFLVYLQFPGFSIVSSSPEILVRAREGKVTIRPIAGTRPRGATPEEDAAFEQDLLADPKERSEHLMLLDLGRNDVGRVARIGTVNVTEQFTIERYSQVMHIVSNVEGELETAKFDALDALVAGFPAGTVSGAPKVRAMEIIDELERDKRGVYAGCVGYFGAGGDMDTCIVLRTAIVKNGTMYVQAGAGVVYDSVAQNEHQECVNKASALFKAADAADAFTGN